MLRPSRFWLLLMGVVALLTLLAVACGGGGEKQGTQTPAASAIATATPRATGTPTVTKTATPRATTTAAAAATPRPTSTAAPSATAAPAATTVAAPATPPAETEEPTATPTPVVPDPGVTDTQIILGSHFAQSGTYGAAYAPVLAGLEAYFSYVNAEQGGVCSREIVLKAEDDNYKPEQAVEVTRKLVEQDQVFAMIANLGTEAHSAVWDYLNEKGIPDLWVMSGAHKWGADPQAHPWTVGFLPDYFVEGAIFGKWISQNLPGKKVGILYQDDDFGHDVLAGLQNGLDPTKNELVSEQGYEPEAVTISAQVANLKAASPEVMVGAGITGATAQAIKETENMGWNPQWLIHFTECTWFPCWWEWVDMAGTLTFQYHKLSTWTDDPAIAEHYEIMRKYGNMAPGNFTIEGQLTAELTVEVLGRTCDNLTRRGLMDAVESLRDYQSELNLPGVTWTISPDDHIGIETMRFMRAKVVPGGGEMWESEGELISFR